MKSYQTPRGTQDLLPAQTAAWNKVEDLIRQIVREESGMNAEMISILSQIAQNTRETADKDLTIGDREIARANTRGIRAMGYSLITEG